uniref:Uncharacterized protein n=1 Tax=Anguilla anguilla TaxID=7936 RepID=A0A0E9SP03_ANGAN
MTATKMRRCITQIRNKVEKLTLQHKSSRLSLSHTHLLSKGLHYYICPVT